MFERFSISFSHPFVCLQQHVVDEHRFIPANGDVIRSPLCKKQKSSIYGSKSFKEIEKEVLKMKKAELQDALRARELDDRGLKQVLQNRLLDAARSEAQLSASLVVKSTSHVVSLASTAPSMTVPSSSYDSMDAFACAAAKQDCIVMAQRSSLETENAITQQTSPKPTIPENLAMEVDAPLLSSAGASEQGVTRSTQLEPSHDEKRSRSPMQRMSESVNSAIKMFSSKAVLHSPKAGSVARDILPSLTKTNGYREHKDSMEAGETKPSSQKVTQTPLNASFTTSAVMSSALKSIGAKAKTNARVARVKELRDKVRSCQTTPW